MMEDPEHERLVQERWTLLRQVNTSTETLFIILSAAWAVLLAIELTSDLHPALETTVYVIWGLFLLDFIVEFTIAPDRKVYLKTNWLTALSMVLPALRVFRIFRLFAVLRAARVARSVRLLRVVSSINQGMRSFRAGLGRTGAQYVLGITTLVTVTGAAGMRALEGAGPQPHPGFLTYGDSLWWTAMLMTTMGSEHWPNTLEGRILGWLLAVYAFAIFGYVTAIIARYFIGKDKVNF